MQILIGSANKDKIKELKSLLSELGIEVLSTLDIKNCPEVIEDKNTIEGNAIKKATELANFSGLPTLADDTGLFVDALNGEPGVYSARWAFEGCTYADNRNKMLEKMQNQTNRNARFKTVVAFADSNGIVATKLGTVEGKITEKEIGEKGFGYDSVFLANETGKTFGEMSDEAKNKISHRARAIKAILPVIKEYFSKK